MNAPRISFGDKVRVRANSSTENHGIAGQTGVVCAFTTPSQTGVKVIGDTLDDNAVAIMIEGNSEPLWLAEDLLDLVDHQAGTTVKVGGRYLIRNAKGEWEDTQSH